MGPASLHRDSSSNVFASYVKHGEPKKGFMQLGLHKKKSSNITFGGSNRMRSNYSRSIISDNTHMLKVEGSCSEFE